MGNLKVWLDDEREAPVGWVRVRWPDEAIALLQYGQVTHLSLDHDLGDDTRGTGYTVLQWLEEQVACHGMQPPVIQIHTANPAARARMLAGVEAIVQFCRSAPEATNLSAGKGTSSS